MAEKIFIDGLMVRDPRNNAPDFILGHLRIKVDELIPFLQKHAKNGWINVDLCRGRSGKPYASLDTWEPQQQPQTPPQAPPPPFDPGNEPMDEIPY